MQLRYILRINQAMRKDEDRAYPYDLTEEALENVTHFSENAGNWVLTNSISNFSINTPKH